MINRVIVVILLVIVVSVPLYFDNSLFSSFDLSKVSLLYLLVFLAVGLWLFGIIWSGDCGFEFRLPQLGVPVIALLGVIGLSTVFSVCPYMSVVGTHKRYGGLLSAVVYALLFFLVVRFIDRKRVGLVVSAIIFTAVVSAVCGVFQSLGLDIYKWNTDFGHGLRVSSTFGHPGFFGAFLAMSIPLVLSRVFSGVGRIRLVCYGLIFVLLLYAFYCTKTRASFVALVVSLSFFFIIVRRQRLKLILVVALFLGVTGYFNISKDSSVVARFSDDVCNKDIVGDSGKVLSGTILNRYLQYKTALRIVADYPILGIGSDTLGMIYPRYYEGPDDVLFENENRIHNNVLGIAVSIGLVGLAVCLWLVVSYSYMAYNAIRSCVPGDKSLLVGVVSGVIAYTVQNLFNFGHIPIIMLFWVLIGLSVVLCGSKSKVYFCIKWNKPVLVVFILFLIVLCGFNASRYRAEQYFCIARRNIERNQYKEAMPILREALKYNPYCLNYRDILNGVVLKVAADERDNTLLRESLAIAIDIQRLFPEHYRAYYTAAQTYHVGGVHEDAVANYRKAIELHPFKPAIKERLAKLLL